MDENKMSEWATFSMREVPFWRDDITLDEYEKERMHWLTLRSQHREAEYRPLYKKIKVIETTSA